MEEIYQLLKDPGYSTLGYSSAAGKDRAVKAINDIFEKLKSEHLDLSSIKNVFLLITSGTLEVTIDEIGDINDFIQARVPSSVNIIMGIADADITNAIEIRIILTRLETSGEIDVTKAFNAYTYDKESLPIYFIENEFSSEEISGIISFLSDLYSDIGGDRLKIKGFQSIDVELFAEPIL